MAHCLNGECCFEGFAWYYDGVRVYHQIHDYTQNDSFLACIEHHRESYFNYVLDNKGKQNAPLQASQLFQNRLIRMQAAFQGGAYSRMVSTWNICAPQILFIEMALDF